MGYKWKPSASQRKQFAQKMADPIERAEYEARKEDKAQKRRAASKFDYRTAGGEYEPSALQHSFCLNHWPANTTPEQDNARNMVMYGYSCSEKVSHDYIHIVNELIRANN